ncbi:Uncharacterized protein TPAR_06938 [Tolypocladium paradoxum]|uniref:F-box domain-containing protein n=1 Tax=Tolypocladium paradoxum TaxID=94208 RepID=A0A2S4KRQ0_9HYPO|nr:Uncharacterized protein TPAR_06938 [Tolypocladium paradoxum]
MIILPRISSVPRLRAPDLCSRQHHQQDSPTTYRPVKLPTAVCRRPAMASLIERLPNELQRMVFSHLDYQSLIHLSRMNRFFQQAIDPQRMAASFDKAQFVMRAAKDFPQHRPSEKGHDYRPGNFECYVCFRAWPHHPESRTRPAKRQAGHAASVLHRLRSRGGPPRAVRLSDYEDGERSLGVQLSAGLVKAGMSEVSQLQRRLPPPAETQASHVGEEVMDIRGFTAHLARATHPMHAGVGRVKAVDVATRKRESCCV